MALVLKDRVKETCTSPGTGSVTLLGASTGYVSFSVIGNGNTTYYTIADQTGNNWEVGIGTYTSSGTTLSRDTVLSNSAGNTSLINFSSGTQDVFVTYPSGRSVYADGATLTATNSSVLPVASGGTGQTSYTDGQLLIGNSTGNTLTKATLTAGSGMAITNGSGSITVAASTIPVANGGTGLTSTPANGALDIGNGTGFTRTTLTAGSGITITNGAGSISIAASGGGGGGFSNMQVFTSNGTFTIPAGITKVKVTVVGGGGGGGGASSGCGYTYGAGAGGGGGGAAIQIFSGLTPANTLTVTVGAAGTATAAGNGGTGGTTSVASGTQSITTVSATGGAGGGAGNTPGGTCVSPGIGFAGDGGSGSGGLLNIKGSPGSTAYNYVSIGSSTGGASILGGGGRGTSGVSNGFAGGSYGGGGGGTVIVAFGVYPAGGVGAAGVVIIEY